MIQSLAAVGLATPAIAATTAPATTQSTLSPDDVAATNRSLGHDYTPEETQLMAGGVKGKRDVIVRIRQQEVDYTTPPAIAFDARLPGQQYATGEPQVESHDPPLPNYNGDPTSLAFITVSDLSQLIRTRKITSLALTKMYLSRLKDIGEKLNCVVTLTEDLALKQATRADEEITAGKHRGPLHGIPWGAKDLLSAKGYPTTWGVEIYKDRVFNHDATVVEKLDAAGAVLCAKLSLGELCMGDVWWKGQTKNPWNPKEGSGGSSAGPCAAVAAGLVAFAIGSETLGSIVSPCMANGTIGLRPTYGRVSRWGAMALSDTMDKLGPIARSVEDCALVLAAIHGPDGRDGTCAQTPFAFNRSTKGLRVGIDTSAFNFETGAFAKSSELRDVYQKSLDQFRDIVGQDLTPIELPPTQPYTGLASLVIACESANNFSDLLLTGDIRKLKQQGEGSWPNTFRIGSTIPAADYLRAMRVRRQLQLAMNAAMHDIDCYLTIPYAGPTIAYTNLTGHPSIVFRAGMFQGRPKLLELIGQPFREDAILALAHAFEEKTDHRRVWPNMSAD